MNTYVLHSLHNEHLALFYGENTSFTIFTSYTLFLNSVVLKKGPMHQLIIDFNVLNGFAVSAAKEQKIY